MLHPKQYINEALWSYEEKDQGQDSWIVFTIGA